MFAFGSVVAVIFQNVLLVNASKYFFYFLKIIFDISASK